MRAIVAAGLTGVLAIAGYTAVSAAPNVEPKELVKPPVVSLNAQSELRLPPDTAVITLGVVSRSSDAQRAMAENRVRMNRIAAALARFGVERSDLQTTELTLRDEERCEPHERTRCAIEYIADNKLSVRVERFTDLGPVLDAAVDGGANQVDGVTFSLGDTEVAKDKARRLAVAELRANAALYAEAAGYRSARLVSLGESYNYRPYYRSAPPGIAPTPIEPGEVDLSVQLNATYELVG